MFWAPLCPSSGAHDDSVGYHIGCLVLELLLVGSSVQAGWTSVRTEGFNTLCVTAFGPDLTCNHQLDFLLQLSR